VSAEPTAPHRSVHRAPETDEPVPDWVWENEQELEHERDSEAVPRFEEEGYFDCEYAGPGELVL
jgi:hypothetical protein